MKRLFFISCLMFMVINVMAYQPMLIEGRIWTFSVSGDNTGIDSIDNRRSFYYYKIEGDSVVNGEVYKKVYKSYYNKTDWNLYCLMMENVEEGKVWKYDYSYISKQYYKNLIFDFSLNVGDRFRNGSSVCENIKYVKDRNGNVLKRMDLGMSCWIEGYGYEYNILIGASYFLSSVEDEEGILIDFSKDLESYNPMVVDGYSWNVVHSGYYATPLQELYGTNKEIIKGDSIIDGIGYKKLWEAEDCDLEKTKLLALIREDVKEQKVYAYNKGAEVLLYDLGVEIGDTIKVLNWLHTLKYLDSTNAQDREYCFSYLVVDNIDYIEDEKYGNLKIVSYHKAEWEQRKVTIYERYGDVTGWTMSSHADVDGGGPGSVICAFDENDELVFKRKYTIKGYGDVKDCYVDARIDRTNVGAPKKVENVYYNLQDGMLYVDFEGDERIDIYDAMGKRVMAKNVDSTTKSIPLNLTSGIYVVTTKNQNIYSKIVVK